MKVEFNTAIGSLKKTPNEIKLKMKSIGCQETHKYAL